MKKQLFFLLTLALIATLIISACGSSEQTLTKTPKPTKTSKATEPAASPLPTATPDPCAPENIAAEVEKVHRLMREFDDVSTLAPYIPQELLYPVISDMQRIRRDVENQSFPSCLATLQQYQLAHMNTVINTMVYLLSQGANAEAEAVNQGIALARQQHDQYVLELANILGLTVVAAPTTTAQGTPEAGGTPTPAPLVITNPGPTTVNLREQPSLEGGTVGILDVGASAVVLGRTADSLWYQVEFPGKPGYNAWVYASLVQLSDPIAELPVVTP